MPAAAAPAPSGGIPGPRRAVDASSRRYREFFVKEAVRTNTVERPDVTNIFAKNHMLQQLTNTVLDNDSLRIVSEFLDARPVKSGMPLASELAATTQAKWEKVVPEVLGKLLKEASEKGDCEYYLNAASNDPGSFWRLMADAGCQLPHIKDDDDEVEEERALAFFKPLSALLSKYGYKTKVLRNLDNHHEAPNAVNGGLLITWDHLMKCGGT
ncbi:unnamed protein product [Amoebophrya sp. A25]|nr:unnamed protein product [Amoebophrya sp. A25]|eukprot:GSA25T00025937001.1